ncbi:NADPH-dependent glutamate synthase [Heliobacterium undosum]|uniref:NADPH-dependent glutamate synthase n=2 Tax=Heliomicrobium undosum TaxID=121734 RepID=A0A845L1V5_9FIRM|nr:NADPH-dependent glutamate synthase [Heliomicrobium undosum]MZP28450.1 NADPH-dependent glutamate synthase [Heliomicrobium undosum]
MSLKEKIRQEMPCQDPQVRRANFDEVALGYTEEQAVKEAARCIQCKKPKCREGCPVEVLIPDFIKAVAERDFAGAAVKLKEKNALPAICGRVCPQESQCEEKCILGIKSEPVAIGRLERFVADWEMAQGASATEAAPAKGAKVAVIGAGPAGLTCAAELAKLGYAVTVFEALHTAGGVLMYGIPEFRLPKAIVDKEIANLRQLGVELQFNVVIGPSMTVEELMNEQGYAAVFLGTGAGLPNFMGIPGENLCGVFSANEFLTRTNLMKGFRFPEYGTPVKLGRKVAVLGAGNVAMDAARTAVRLGAEEVTIVYRRSDKEMPARAEEIEHAREEGVQFKLLTNPVEIIGDENGWVKAMKCLRYELGEPDASGRRKPVAIPGSEFVMDMDTVIVAIGTGPNPLATKSTAGLELNRRGNIVADEEGRTSIPGVFAGGDIVTGAATVILAMGAGKKAAQAIDAYITAKAAEAAN